MPAEYPAAQPAGPDAAPHDLAPQQRAGRWVAGAAPLPAEGTGALAAPDGLERRACSDRRAGAERRTSQLPYSGPERRNGLDRRSGIDRRSAAWRTAAGAVEVSGAPNRYGLSSRSEQNYPQLYQPLSSQWWQGLSEEQRAAAIRLQAAAQERVGFERGTPKFFIGDIQPEGPAGPGEGPPLRELTEADTEYDLRRKAYEQRRREQEEIAQGKRKRVNRFTAGQDESNCYVLGLSSVQRGILATPALRWMLGGTAGAADKEQEMAQTMQGSGPNPHLSADEGGYSAASSEGLIGGAAQPERREGVERRRGQQPYSGPERRSAERREAAAARPQPDYGHTAAPASKLSGAAAQTASSNVFGLASKSQLNYPTAYAPVSREMWAELSAEQQAEIMRTQAIAQEKVGYEKHTTKYFIADFDPANPSAPAIAPLGAPSLHAGGPPGAAQAGGSASAAAARLLTAGVLLGAGGLGLGLALAGLLPLLPGGAAAGAALLIGIVLTAFSWR